MADPSEFDTTLREALDATYVVERELPGGGMSRVFLATERSLNRKVVIKVLPPELAAGVNRERFRREIQLAAQLQHPHIVPLYAAGEHGDLLYYTMPFIEGESLKHAVQAGTRFSPRDVLRVLHDVVDALAYAHARGVVHRDIKPGNVLRSGTHAVVTDFGVAKAISASLPAVGTTTSGMAIGTPAYMAPEQLAGDPLADHRVDLYAVGLLAYELLTGDAPFTGASPQAMMAAQLTKDPEPIAKRRPDVPPQLSALIMHCLEKAPEARPQSAAEVIAALDAIAMPSGDYAALRPRHRSRALGALVLLLAMGGILLARRDRPGAAPEAAPPPPADSVRATKSPTVPASSLLITREDSLAIAAAVEKRMGMRAPAQATSPAASAAATAAMAHMVDSLVKESERRLIDSLTRNARQSTGPDPMRAIRSALIPVDSLRVYADRGRGALPLPTPGDSAARPAGGRGGRGDPRFGRGGTFERRRVVITELPSRDHADLAPLAHLVADTLSRLFARTRAFTVVPADSVKSALATSRYAQNVGTALHAELFASVGVQPAGKDSVSFIVILRDLGAAAAAPRTVTMPAVSVAQPLTGIDRLLGPAIGELLAISRSPRIDVNKVAAPAAGTGTPAVPSPPAAPLVKKP